MLHDRTFPPPSMALTLTQGWEGRYTPPWPKQTPALTHRSDALWWAQLVGLGVLGGVVALSGGATCRVGLGD